MIDLDGSNKNYADIEVRRVNILGENIRLALWLGEEK